MASEDITFCANKGCPDMKCERNPKHIRLLIPHSFALFTNCPKWKPGNAAASKPLSDEEQRVTELVKVLKVIIRWAGFELINRIELRERRSGRTYR